MSDTLVIVGAGGHGKACLNVSLDMNIWENIVFFDDDTNKKRVGNYPVYNNFNIIKKNYESADFFVAIGNTLIRENIINKLLMNDFNIVTLKHTKSVISHNVFIDKGVVIMPGVVIGPGSNVNKGAIINTNATVDHDVNIGSYSHISPGVNIAGDVNIGERTWVGIGTTVINGVTIDSDIYIGAGSLVLKDINNPGMYYGSPAEERKI